MGGWNDEARGIDPKEPLTERAHARILVTDDDAALRRLLTATLHLRGYDVYEARSGEELLWAAEAMSMLRWPNQAFDLIITDRRLLGLGLEGVEKIRRSNFTGPILLTTASPDAREEAEATRAGASLLSKPFSLAALDALVSCLCWPQTQRERVAHDAPAPTRRRTCRNTGPAA